MFTLCRRHCTQNIIKTILRSSSNKAYSNVFQFASIPTINDRCHNLQILRQKSKKSKPARAEVSESETEPEKTFDDEIVDKATKIMNIGVKSMRIDGLLKSGLGIARNKIETLFYESKIRLNGKKLLKKSDMAQEGDEIDVVKGPCVTNPNFLTVARVEVLAVSEKGDNISVKIRRCKNLTVEKYEDDTS